MLGSHAGSLGDCAGAEGEGCRVVPIEGFMDPAKKIYLRAGFRPIAPYKTTSGVINIDRRGDGIGAKRLPGR